MDRALDFYIRGLGLTLLDRAGPVARLGAGSTEVLALHGDPAARRVRQTAGLYHFALLVPSRAALGSALRHLVEAGIPLQGASDHLVSEAVYLADPDGNGIEIYRDRDRAEWAHDGLFVRMATDPLDAQGVLASAEPWSGALAAGTRMGHVHLHVADIAAAEAFYHGTLGFDITARYGRAATFLSAGGYHHHIAVNTWAGVGVKPNPEGALGLRSYTLLVPDAAELNRIAATTTPEARHDGELILRDPSGNTIRIRPQM